MRSRVPFICLLACAVTAVCVAAAGAQPGVRPRLAPIRQAENFASLADPAARTLPLDALKYVSLGKPGHFLSVGAEVRALHEYYEHEDWGRSGRGADSSWLLRSLIHTDIRLGRHLRVFGQVGSGLESGRDGGPRPADEADLYLNAGFVELGTPLGDTSRLDLRLGRMELSYGWGRLICFRGRPTLKRSHDGGLLRWRDGRRRTDFFLTWDVRRHDGTFASERLDDRHLMGLYHSQPLADGRSLDLYLLNSDRPTEFYYLDPTSSAPMPGDENRTTLGARLEHRLGRFYNDVEISYQLGSYAPLGGAEQDIAAFAIGIRTRLRDAGPYQLELGMDLEFSSGDGDPGDDQLGTFRAPAPGAAFLGGGHYFGYGNLGLAHALAAVRPLGSVRVQAGLFLFWRDSASDGSYALPGRPYLPAANTTELGLTPELVVSWDLATYTRLDFEITSYVPAEYQDLVTPGEDMLFVGSQLVFRF